MLALEDVIYRTTIDILLLKEYHFAKGGLWISKSADQQNWSQYWLASNFPLCYQFIITCAGHENQGNDHQRQIVLIKQVLPTSPQQNAWNPARRICIIKLGLKGLVDVVIRFCFWDCVASLLPQKCLWLFICQVPFYKNQPFNIVRFSVIHIDVAGVFFCFVFLTNRWQCP